MKNTLATAMILGAVLIISGCASDQAHQQYISGFSASAKAYYSAAEKPLLDLTLPAPGGESYHLVVNRDVEPMQPQQIKDSEWVGPVKGLINAGMMLGGMFIAADSAGDTTNTGGGDYVTGTQSNPVTTTTTTETTTTDIIPVAE